MCMKYSNEYPEYEIQIQSITNGNETLGWNKRRQGMSNINKYCWWENVGIYW